MKKKRKTKNPKTQLIAPKPFRPIKFNNSLFIVFLAILVLLIAFIIYSNSYIEIESEDSEEIIEEPIFLGNECTEDIDCQQPRCPGVKGLCEEGYCINRRIIPSIQRCFDLKTPICGNNICESDETEKCPEDCNPSTEIVCNNDGHCEYDLANKYSDWNDNEDSDNCPSDCWCGDNICDDYEKKKGICLEDC